jgi:hypothetical protein
MGSDEEDRLIDMQVEAALPGAVITIPRPASVNVEVSVRPENAARLEGVMDEFGNGSNSLPSVIARDPTTGFPTSIVVPVLPISRYSEWHDRVIPGDRRYGYAPSKVEIRDHIRCELGFAVTIHKAGEWLAFLNGRECYFTKVVSWV